MATGEPSAAGEERICFVRTVLNRCRVCYTCVRKCPAKAIRITKSQAEIVPERCIGCGSCIRVCSQGAKQVVSTIGEVEALLGAGRPLAACLAPSFPVEFQAECDHRILVGMIRALGFGLVCEVAFGADLVAARYRQLLETRSEERFIATTCPAIVGFVERYHPELIPHLAPIASPMVAMARALRRLHGPELGIVFIGPCIAKKVEACDPDVAGGPDAVLTFRGLREMFAAARIQPQAVAPSDFDPPRPSLGALFPITGGLLQAAQIEDDLLQNDIVATDGLSNFTSALNEFEAGNIEAQLLELLSCHGCIAGPGTTSRESNFKRRARVSDYVRGRMAVLDRAAFQRDFDQLGDLDLDRGFRARDQRLADLDEAEIGAILERMGKRTGDDHLNCGACGYQTCREHAVAIHKGLAEGEMCLPFVIDELKKTVRTLSVTNDQLASAQETLMHSERLASMGQLAAGVAHELNNPLGVVLMYTHLMLDECPADHPLRADLEMIAEQSDRCKRIVAGLLDFARQNRVDHRPTDVRALVEHALGGLPPPAGIQVALEDDGGEPLAEVDGDQVLQILINLVANAYDAMPEGGRVTLRTGGDAHWATIEVQDTGPGIPREHLKKIFEPFFTTKQMGKGTGLGLAVVYGIVKMHRGDIGVQTNPDPAAGPTGTTFTVKLPRRHP